MKSIKTLRKEHDIILSVLESSEELLYRFMEDKGLYDVEDIYLILDFIENYADEHHHKKEEDILFNAMEDNITKISVKEPITGMYIEHDFGRMYRKNTENAMIKFMDGCKKSKLYIIGNLIAYIDLLNRHILKENNGIYNLAETDLDDLVKEEIEAKFEYLELKAKKKGIQAKYKDISKYLADKYI